MMGRRGRAGNRLVLAALGVVGVLVFAGCDWTMFGYDGALTHSSPDMAINSANVSTVQQLFTFTGSSSGEFGSPVESNGVVYIGAFSGNLYAFDANGALNCSGTPNKCSPLWTGSTAGNDPTSAPAVANGVVYIVSANGGTLSAFDANGITNCSGTPKVCQPLWTAPTTLGADSSVVVVNGVVYIGGDDTGNGAGSRRSMPTGSPTARACRRPASPSGRAARTSDSPRRPLPTGSSSRPARTKSFTPFPPTAPPVARGRPRRAIPCGRTAWAQAPPTWSRPRPPCRMASSTTRTPPTCTPSTRAGSPTARARPRLAAPCGPRWAAAYSPPRRWPTASSTPPLTQVLRRSTPTGSPTCSGTPKTCTPLWTYNVSIDGSSPSLANGLVFVGRFEGGLVAFDARGVTNCSGTPKVCNSLWTGPTGQFVTGSPAIANGKVYVTDNAILSGFGDLYAWVLPPPTTKIAIPSNNATVSGGQYLDAGASPGVTMVQYELTGGTVNHSVIATATPTIVGWLAGWDTTTVPNGTYTLESVASYGGEVSGTSAPVTITVNN